MDMTSLAYMMDAPRQIRWSETTVEAAYTTPPSSPHLTVCLSSSTRTRTIKLQDSRPPGLKVSSV